MKYKLIREELPKIKESINPEPIAHVTLHGRRITELTDVEKLQIAREYFLTGNLSEIARSTGVFYNDLLELARESLFQEEVKNLEREANAQLKVRFASVLGSTLSQIEDRIANGDHKIVDKKVKRVPVAARDLATIVGIIFDKKQAIEESEKGFGSTEAKKLLAIADALRNKGLEAKPIEAKVIENGEDEV